MEQAKSSSPERTIYFANLETGKRCAIEPNTPQSDIGYPLEVLEDGKGTLIINIAALNTHDVSVYVTENNGVYATSSETMECTEGLTRILYKGLKKSRFNLIFTLGNYWKASSSETRTQLGNGVLSISVPKRSVIKATKLPISHGSDEYIYTNQIISLSAAKEIAKQNLVKFITRWLSNYVIINSVKIDGCQTYMETQNHSYKPQYWETPLFENPSVKIRFSYKEDCSFISMIKRCNPSLEGELDNAMIKHLLQGMNGNKLSQIIPFESFPYLEVNMSVNCSDKSGNTTDIGMLISVSHWETIDMGQLNAQDAIIISNAFAKVFPTCKLVTNFVFDDGAFSDARKINRIEDKTSYVELYIAKECHGKLIVPLIQDADSFFDMFLHHFKMEELRDANISVKLGLLSDDDNLVPVLFRVRRF